MPNSVALPNLTGTVFSDIDGNGERNAGEPGIPGVAVSLESDTGVIIAGEVTDTSGLYAFSQRVEDDGEYFIRVTVPANYTNTTPDRVAVNLGAQGTQVVDFGLQSVTYVVYLPFVTRD